MTGNYSEEMGAVKSDLQTLKDDLATLTKSVKADAQANAMELRANARTKFDAARANAVEAGTLLVKKMPKSDLSSPEQDGKTVIAWAAENGLNASPIMSALNDRI
mgnify:CR=1 FL=1